MTAPDFIPADDRLSADGTVTFRYSDDLFSVRIRLGAVERSVRAVRSGAMVKDFIFVHKGEEVRVVLRRSDPTADAVIVWRRRHLKGARESDEGRESGDR